MKALPKLTMVTAYSNDEPSCPHCGAGMDNAKTTLGQLRIGWPHGGFIHTREDGYAHPGDYLEMDCNECFRPSAVKFDSDGSVTLIAARTDADERLLGVQ